MTQTYFPFDSGAGADSREAQWTKMAQHWLATGIIKDIHNELHVYADTSGMLVRVNPGAAWIKGHYFESDALETLPIASSDFTNPRIDRVVVRLDWVANTIGLAVLQGAPAVNPIAPSLTQNTARWELPLAQVRVDAQALTIADNKLIDERVFARNANIQPKSHLPLTLLNGFMRNGTVDYPPQFQQDNLGYVHIMGSVYKEADVTNGTVLSILPEGDRPAYNIQSTVYCITANASSWGIGVATVRPTGEIAFDQVIPGTRFVLFNLVPYLAEK